MQIKTQQKVLSYMDIISLTSTLSQWKQQETFVGQTLQLKLLIIKHCDVQPGAGWAMNADRTLITQYWCSGSTNVVKKNFTEQHFESKLHLRVCEVVSWDLKINES